jgi:hypothetical protein
VRLVCPSDQVCGDKTRAMGVSWDCTQSDGWASDIVAALGEWCSGGVLGRRSGQYPGWLSSESSGEPGVELESLVAVRMSRTSVYPCTARQGGWLIPNV